MAMQDSVQGKVQGAIGATVIVGLLGYALIAGLSETVVMRVDQALTLLNLAPAPPPPPQIERPTISRAKGAPSPRNIENKAAEIVLPPPVVPPPLPTPVVSTPKPESGMAASSGASNLPGNGEGAGGEGDGTGAGGEGDDGGDVPPRQIKGHLKFSDLPETLRHLPASAAVGVRYDIETDGHVSKCAVITSSGNPALDQATCALIQQHFRFRPGHDSDGRPFPSTMEERHIWDVDEQHDSEDR